MTPDSLIENMTNFYNIIKFYCPYSVIFISFVIIYVFYINENKKEIEKNGKE